MQECRIKHTKIATGLPQANGQVERINGDLAPMLAKLTDHASEKRWYEVLREVEYAMNNTIHRNTKNSPGQLLLGIEQRGLVPDSLREVIQSENTQDLADLRTRAAEKIIQAQAEQHTYDKKHKAPHTYNEGDLVLIRNFDSTPGTSKKLIPRFKGPYELTKVLPNNRDIVADRQGFQNTQRLLCWDLGVG